jgi:hypothetical protein
MDYFGINDISELPTPKDFAKEGSEIGEQEDSISTTLDASKQEPES